MPLLVVHYLVGHWGYAMPLLVVHYLVGHAGSLVQKEGDGRTVPRGRCNTGGVKRHKEIT
eukprot:scaffold45725_cov23-Tisochrysis_lutea.AAC.1